MIASMNFVYYFLCVTDEVQRIVVSYRAYCSTI